MSGLVGGYDPGEKPWHAFAIPLGFAAVAWALFGLIVLLMHLSGR